MSSAARQIEDEQQLVDRMYARLDSEINRALTLRNRILAAPADDSQELFARDAQVARLSRRVAELRAAEPSLCFGRIDQANGESVHIGRIGLRGDDGTPLLVDWRAAAARPFYAATPASPMGLRRRRHLRVEGRRVVDVTDELLDGSAPNAGDVVGDGPLVAALGRARTGRMREAVATLQSEQDAVVRSPECGVLVVDGGPGTGKTIVALHRAAYVLYAFPAIAERGVLVFGPNRRFLDYISGVLPSLGENDVRMATPADLADGSAGDSTANDTATPESDQSAEIKGKAALASALARWVRGHQPSATPLEFHLGGDTIVAGARRVDNAQRLATQGGVAHNRARAAFKEYVVDDLVNLLEKRTIEELTAMDNEVARMLGRDLDKAVAEDLRALGLDDAVSPDSPEIDWEAIRENLLDDPAIDAVVEKAWPRLDATTAVRSVLSDRAALATLAPELPDDEISLLVPPRVPYTDADLALLDEARALIDGPAERVYGHIVVDEAQELSQMQWRMLMRRCPARSLTIVGDFAQAGSATTIGSWTEALSPFGGDFTHHTLTINYRTTAEILDASAPLLARIDPSQKPSRSIRHGENPRILVAGENDIAVTLRQLVRQMRDDYPGELIGVVVPAPRLEEIAAQVPKSAATVIAAPQVRGLEFDTVIVVDPDGIESARRGGLRDRYVATTRATKRIVTLQV